MSHGTVKRWLERSCAARRRSDQALFGIVQGGFSNLAFLLRWMHEMRVAILEGRFEAWRLDARSAYAMHR